MGTLPVNLATSLTTPELVHHFRYPFGHERERLSPTQRQQLHAVADRATVEEIKPLLELEVLHHFPELRLGLDVAQPVTPGDLVALEQSHVPRQHHPLLLPSQLGNTRIPRVRGAVQ